MSKRHGRSSTNSRTVRAEAKPSRPAPANRRIRDYVSETLKRARQAAGLTLEQLAARVSVHAQGEIPKISTSHLNRIENNQARPSDEELYWINEALKRPLGQLFRQPEPAWYVVSAIGVETRLTEISEGSRTVVRKDAEKAHEFLIDKKIYKYVPLEPDGDETFIPEKSFAPLAPLLNRISLLEIEPADLDLMQHPKALDKHEGQEALFCLIGEIEFWREQDGARTRVRLGPGDFLRLDSSQLHGFRALGTKPARALHIYAAERDAEVKEIIETREHK